MVTKLLASLSIKVLTIITGSFYTLLDIILPPEENAITLVISANCPGEKVPENMPIHV